VAASPETPALATGFGGFFCFKNSGFVFNERVKLYFYDKRAASHFFMNFGGFIVF
jgi:hypothetical protein